MTAIPTVAVGPIAEKVADSVHISGSPMIDMLFASILASAVMTHMPQIIKSITDLLALLMRKLIAFRFGPSEYKHSVEITSTSNPQSNDNNDNYYNENNNTAVHSPNTQSTDNLPLILGTLHYFQTHKIHFNTRGSLVGHVQSAITERTTRDQLHKAVLSFIPEAPVIHEGMRFTFKTSVSNGGDDQQNDQGTPNNDYDDGNGGGKKKKPTGQISTMSMTVEGNDLLTIEKFLSARFHEEVDLAYPKPDTDDGKQYLFELNVQENHGNNNLMWFRSPFGTNKTFRTVFFEQKQMLIDTINHFQNKTGPWAPERERPNKLVILLEGLPGTGKSGSIKAIANMTKRHILSINASDLKDDSQVARLFRDEGMHFISAGQWRNEVLEQDRRILVFEDLDANGNTDWLLDRKKKKEKSLNDEDSFLEMFSDINDSKKKRGKGKMKGFGSDDKLFRSGPTLGGLLNVLDGVCELNGQIVILTTNHLDIFDPALYRAGRVDLRISMSYSSATDLINMTECAFDKTLTSEQKQILTAAGEACRWTGSDIQELLQGANNIDQAVEIIRAKHQSYLSRPDTGSSSNPSRSASPSSTKSTECLDEKPDSEQEVDDEVENDDVNKDESSVKKEENMEDSSSDVADPPEQTDVAEQDNEDVHSVEDSDSDCDSDYSPSNNLSLGMCHRFNRGRGRGRGANLCLSQQYM